MLDAIIDKAIDVLYEKKPGPAEFTDLGLECFAATEPDGTVHICWRGVWYSETRLTLKTRLHNWLVAIHNRRWLGDA